MATLVPLIKLLGPRVLRIDRDGRITVHVEALAVEFADGGSFYPNDRMLGFIHVKSDSAVTPHAKLG